MANSEDVLEMAKRTIESCPAPRRVCGSCGAIETLAAEVRGLRRDRARLDWLETCQSINTGRENRYEVISTTRTQIDAAMGGGEGGATSPPAT